MASNVRYGENKGSIVIVSVVFVGCRDKVQAVAFAPRSKQLLSAGDDRVVAYWNMDIKRLEVGLLLGMIT